MKKDQLNEGSKKNPSGSETKRNHDQQGVDKTPGEEKRKGEKSGRESLKRKREDADPSQESGRPR